ncbi:amino acid transporters [Acetobacter aceti NRIC 0242]|nr:hypothetical protein EDC15_10368 [Acetobacter aceti NBRC 14818]GAN56337.1 hypothetical protein Abac_006_065 [Acetobacter aceti NBRC 14818]GBO79693.1 amino acid transporters [Acetobacter aceti NRIC 0242]
MNIVPLLYTSGLFAILRGFAPHPTKGHSPFDPDLLPVSKGTAFGGSRAAPLEAHTRLSA